MNITIFGASGRTGQQLVSQALDRGHQVTAYMRRPEALTIPHPGLRVITGTLNEPDKLREAISGAEACLSALGGNSLRKRSTEFTTGMDRIVSLTEQEGVPRLVYLSSVGAGESRSYLPQPFRFLIADMMLRVPLADHTLNEQRIAGSKLQWTVVRPGGLGDGPITGKITHGCGKTVFKSNATISRADVASFMLDQLSETTYVNKAVWLKAG
jgi:putative NADH-flavin reductase